MECFSCFASLAPDVIFPSFFSTLFDDRNIDSSDFRCFFSLPVAPSVSSLWLFERVAGSCFRVTFDDAFTFDDVTAAEEEAAFEALRLTSFCLAPPSLFASSLALCGRTAFVFDDDVTFDTCTLDGGFVSVDVELEFGRFFSRTTSTRESKRR